MKGRSIEIFCGTGGVGKTTLACSRALYLAQANKKVLVITIDPAKRLKELLQMDEGQAGEVKEIKSEIFGAEWAGQSFHALLMSPEATLKRIQNSNQKANLKNPILKALTRPYAGMNEIMGLLEVQHFYSEGGFDSIILDTPPGKHFVDFLLAANKINRFFDRSFIDIFKHLGKKIKGLNTSKKEGPLTSIVSRGIKKLLGYLEKVTGAEFVEQFIDAVASLYEVQDSFVKAIKFQDELQSSDKCNWVLVTSAQQIKGKEALELMQETQQFVQGHQFLAVNKCLGPLLQNWHPDSKTPLGQLKQILLQREESIKSFSNDNSSSIIVFPEVMGHLPAQHVAQLAKNWESLRSVGNGIQNQDKS